MDPQEKAAHINARGGIIAAVITAILAPIILFFALPHIPINNGTDSSSSQPNDKSINGTSIISTTPTTPLKTKTVSHRLTCTSNCDSVAGLQIVVLSFTFDTAQGQTFMNLSLTAQRNYSSCHFADPGSSAIGGSLNFQDSTGKTYEPGGQLEYSYHQFSLGPGQSVELAATYPFIPSSGSRYTLLSTGLSCDQVNDYPVYETVQITF